MYKLIVTLFLVVAFTGIQSQPPIEWQKTIGGSGSDFGKILCYPKDSTNYYTAGYSGSTDGDITGNHGGFDIFLSKVDLAGNLKWTKAIGGIQNDYTQDIIHTSDGGLLICGFTMSNDSLFPGNHGGFDVVFIKTDTAGNIMWIKLYGGSGDDGDHAAGVIETPDRGFVCHTGTASNDADVSGNHGSNDYWVFKTDSVGNLLWQKCFGGTGDEDGHVILPMPDGGLIIAGHSASTDGDVSGLHSPGVHDGWVVRLDAARNIIWQKCIGGSDFELINKICFDNNGNIAIIGYTASSDGDISGQHGQDDVWVIKIDSVAGNIIWSKVYGGSSEDLGNDIFVNSDGSLTAVAYTNSLDGDVSGNNGNFDYWILKLDSAGSIIWDGNYGGTGMDWCSRALPTADKGILVSGFTNSADGDVAVSYGSMDSWLIKLHCVKPHAEFLPHATALCPGDMALLTNTSVGAATYEWYVNGNYVANTNNLNIALPTAGNYSVTLIAALDNCSDSSTQIVTVSPNLPVSVNITANPAGSICSGTSVTFTASPTNGGATPAYQWQNNGANINGATNNTYTSAALADNDNITCLLTSNATPCITGSPATSNTITMNVNPSLAAFVVITANPAGTICNGTSVTFTASPTNGGATPLYQWLINGININGATNNTYTSNALADNDNITCVMTSNAAPCLTGSPAISNTINMNVNPNPVVYLGKDTIVVQGTTVTLDAGNPGASYSWSTGQLSQTVIISSSDTVSVVVNLNGCIAMDTIIVTVITGISEFDKKINAEIFPNPTSGILNISFSNSNPARKIDLFSADGKIIYSQQAAEEKVLIDFTKFNEGIYFLRIYSESNSRIIKVVKN